MKTSQFTKHEPPVPVLLKKTCTATDSTSLVTTTKSITQETGRYQTSCGRHKNYVIEYTASLNDDNC